MVSVLYHGSLKQNLGVLKPAESGHNKRYVYAVSEKAFAAIFVNRVGGSLVASWGRLDDGTPYYCERKRGVFESNYANKKGSIYELDKKDFVRIHGLWKYEYVSQKSVKPLNEIKIPDLKKYLLELEAEGKLKIIFYKDRKMYLPNIDKDLIKTVRRLIKKYGYEKVLPNLKKYQPKIFELIDTEHDFENY